METRVQERSGSVFTLLLLLTAVQLTEQWARKLPDGVEITVDKETAIIQGEWTIFITITKPNFPDYLLKGITQLIQRVNSTTINTWATVAMSRLQLAANVVSTPVSWWNPKRRRRGVINGIGHAMNFLFGTATEDELRDVKDILNEIQKEQGAITQWIDQFTVVINHTYTEIQTNRNHLNKLAAEIEGIATELNSGLAGLLRQIRIVRGRQAISEMITQISMLAEQYARDCELWQQRKTHLEAGRLTESLLPPTTLHSILSTSNPHPGRIIEPLQWYYEHTYIQPVWTDDLLIYRVKLPLISPEQWHFVKISTWPVPLQQWQATLLLPREVLRDTQSGGLDISPQCYGYRPRVCNRGLTTQATAYHCLTRLLAANPSYAPDCALVMQRRMPIDSIYPHPQNGFILITNGTTLIRRCAGQVERAKQ